MTHGVVVTRMKFSRVYISTTAPLIQPIPIQNQTYSRITVTSSPPNRNNLTFTSYPKVPWSITWSGYHDKSNRSCRDPCVAFLQNFVKIGWVFCVILLTNKQTNALENISLLCLVHRGNKSIVAILFLLNVILCIILCLCNILPLHIIVRSVPV